jgi:membrane-associated phospholipid phosphatase
MLDDEQDAVAAGAASISDQPLGSVRYFSWQSRDFRELIACVAFAIVCLLTVMIPMTPNQRPIPYQLLNDNEYVRNLTYDQILQNEAVPDKAAVVLALLLPLCAQMLTAKFFGLAGDMHRTFCIYLVAFAITMSTTELVKNYVGFLRPIFYENCEPNEDYTACTDPNSNDVRKSFPSGHSSSSFCGLLLLYVNK